MPAREIAVVPLGSRFVVVDRHLWDVDKKSGDTTLIGKSGMLSAHETEAEANAARDALITQLKD